MMFRSSVSGFVAAWFIACLAPATALAQSLESFQTSSGKCTPVELRELSSTRGGYTFTTQPAQIYVASGLSPDVTDVEIPAMTGMACHMRDRNKILVSSEDDGYCGWIDKAATLGARRGKQNDLGGLLPDKTVCGTVAPLSLKEFCEKNSAIDVSVRECQNKSISNSPFETKFLVWNTGLGADRAKQIDVPLYRTAEEKGGLGSGFKAVRIFNVLRVFDVKKGPDNTIRYLIGANEKRMEGWVAASAGAIWYSKLATFFTEKSTQTVLKRAPGARSNKTLATKPAAIGKMLKGAKEFRRYPVLNDKRKRTRDDPGNKRPYLEIAYIGEYCGKDARCSSNPDSPGGITPSIELLQRADIVFLIDATRSMRSYFKLVADAVKNVAADYIGTPDYQFGIALYGDHIIRGRTKLNDKLQFRVEFPLATLFDGTELDSLSSAELYTKDPQGDTPEAVYAGLLSTIKAINWRGKEPRFIIHIADHGDRIKTLPRRVIKALRDAQIFYMPVAVLGSKNRVENQNFVRLISEIFDQHRTPRGIPIGIEPQVTYADGTEVGAEAAYTEIAGALKRALELGKKIRKRVLDDLYRKSASRGKRSGARISGRADLTSAALELYGISIEDIKNKRFPVAARGFIETAEIGRADKDWEYFAAIRPQHLGDLQNAFERLCGYIQDTKNSANVAYAAVRRITSILTGDTFKDRQQFLSYFKQRDNIPLASRTMLGEGLIKLLYDLSSTTKKGIERVALYQKEVCRSAELMKRMLARQRLDRPYEGGDLVWKASRKRYSYSNARQFNWIFPDLYGEVTVFLPLSYLPRAPDRVQQGRTRQRQ